MANLNILTNNLVKSDGVEFSMITGTENVNFPLTNLFSNFTTKSFRSLENTSSILIDLKQTRDIDIFAIVGNNLTGLGVTTLDITFSATNDFTGQTPISVNLNSDFNFGYVEFTSVSARYVRISMTDTGEYCELSNFFIGSSEKLEFNGLSQDSFKFGLRDNSTRVSNEYGQEFINVRNQAKTLSGSINFANKVEVDVLERVLKEHINGKPLWLIIDQNDLILTNGNFRLSGYYKLTNQPDFSASGVSLFNIPLSFQEVV